MILKGGEEGVVGSTAMLSYQLSMTFILLVFLCLLSLLSIAALISLYLLAKIYRVRYIEPAAIEDFDTALDALRVLKTRDSLVHFEVCHSHVLHHQEKRPHCFVLLHGYSNCPKQFLELGEQLFARGHNVIIPRMPYHGYKNRLTSEVLKISAEDLLKITGRSVAAAKGLGEEVTLIGLSMGGLLTAFFAQCSQHVDRALTISPFFGIYGMTANQLRRVGMLSLIAPNRYHWWHPELKDEAPGPPHAYPRLATRNIAELLRISFSLFKRAQQAEIPSCKQLLYLENLGDQSIDNQRFHDFLDIWRDKGLEVTGITFSEELGLPHDIIDNSQPLQQVGMVYGRVLELLDA